VDFALVNHLIKVVVNVAFFKVNVEVIKHEVVTLKKHSLLNLFLVK
jgi:hypothetical protein